MEKLLDGARVLVTGGTGFLGKYVMAALASQGAKAIPISKRLGFDLRNEGEFKGALLIEKPDIVVHLAATVGGIGANMANPAVFFRDNMQMGMNVIDGCAQAACKLIFISTVCAYPKDCPTPFREEDIWNGYPEETNAPYGIAKKAGHVMCEAYRKQYGLQYGYLIPANLYGPCFTGDTEVLTPNGVKNIKELSVGDPVFTLDPKTHRARVSKVIATQRSKARELFSFENSSVSFQVTPDHKMYYRTSTGYVKRNAEWFRGRAGKEYGQMCFAWHGGFDQEKEVYPQCISLRDCIDEHHVVDESSGTVRDFLHSHSHPTPFVFEPKAFMEFLGWYISEGSVQETVFSSEGIPRGQISISQCIKANRENHLRIGLNLSALGLQSGSDNDRHYISSRLLSNFIRKEVGLRSENVRIPSFVFSPTFPNDLRRELFESLMRGDGDDDGGRYSTRSLVLANQVNLLCFLLGRKSHVASDEDGYMHRVYIRTVKESAAIKYKDISVMKFDEEQDVYCVTVERDHLIYAGRDGKLNWIGQCDNFDEKSSHVIPAMIKRFADAVESEAPEVTCWGTGKATRSFLFAADAAKAIAIACAELDSDKIVNLPGSEEISMKKLAETVAKILKYKGRLNWDSTRPDGQPKRLVDGTRARQMLGWAPETALHDGLEQTIDWYLELRRKAALV